MNIPDKPLPIGHIKRMEIPRRYEDTFNPIDLYDIQHEVWIENVIDAVPYYLLAYGNNLTKLGTIIPEKRIGLILGLCGKALSYLAKRYKIDEKTILK